MSSMWIALMVVGIVAIVAGTIRHWNETRGSKESHEALDSLRKRVDELDAELRDRVETLERIVTDDKETLKRKIDAL